MENKSTVLVSGFGPFGKHKVNASWVGVLQISSEDLEKRHNIQLIKVEIPVVYKEVDKLVPSLWKDHKPKLVIHVGVSAQATKLTLETVANGINYTRSDCEGRCPDDSASICCKGNLKKILCGLDVQKICEEYNQLNKHLQACVSTDAGRYLCEYTYFTSLSMDSSKTLFVHVPDISDNITGEHIGDGLESIINICLKQLNKCHK